MFESCVILHLMPSLCLEPFALIPGVDNNLVLLAAALSVPSIYGDERDNLLAKWNQLQAFWGTGSGFVNQNTTVNFSPENPFCRFKVRSNED